MGRRRTIGALVAILVVALAAPLASGGERVRLDREGAEFTARFFAIVHGSPLGGDVHANCRKRIALNVRGCRVSWQARKHAVKARLVISAFAIRPDANRYRVRYRLRDLDLRCAETRPESDCTTRKQGTDRYTGG